MFHYKSKKKIIKAVIIFVLWSDRRVGLFQRPQWRNDYPIELKDMTEMGEKIN